MDSRRRITRTGCARLVQLDEDGGLQGIADVGLATAVEYRDQPGVARIHFSWIHLAALLGVGRHRHRMQKERILQMVEQFVESVYRPAAIPCDFRSVENFVTLKCPAGPPSNPRTIQRRAVGLATLCRSITSRSSSTST